MSTSSDRLRLPPPDEIGGPPLAAALAKRRSVRAFSPRAIALEDLAQLMWCAQGVTEPREGLRGAPSAGGLYPLELHVACEAGVFRYDARSHTAARRIPHDVRSALAAAAYSQECVAEAAAVFALCAVASRAAVKYGTRSTRYVALEAGHAAQNLLLQACALQLGAVPVGAFDDAEVAHVLRLGAGEAPLYLVAVGRPRE